MSASPLSPHLLPPLCSVVYTYAPESVCYVWGEAGDKAAWQEASKRAHEVYLRIVQEKERSDGDDHPAGLYISKPFPTFDKPASFLDDLEKSGMNFVKAAALREGACKFYSFSLYQILLKIKWAPHSLISFMESLRNKYGHLLIDSTEKRDFILHIFETFPPLKRDDVDRAKLTLSDLADLLFATPDPELFSVVKEKNLFVWGMKGAAKSEWGRTLEILTSFSKEEIAKLPPLTKRSLQRLFVEAILQKNETLKTYLLDRKLARPLTSSEQGKLDFGKGFNTYQL